MAGKLIITGTAALLGLAMRHSPAIGFRSPPPHRKSAGTPVKPYRPSSNAPHQGAKEMQRRRRQMAKKKETL